MLASRRSAGHGDGRPGSRPGNVSTRVPSGLWGKRRGGTFQVRCRSVSRAFTFVNAEGAYRFGSRSPRTPAPRKERGSARLDRRPRRQNLSRDSGVVRALPDPERRVASTTTDVPAGVVAVTAIDKSPA